MKLIIGLGNPDTQYDGSRHNTGFFVLDVLAKKHDITFKPTPKLKANIAKYMHHDQQVLLVKPTTYYNLVGESVQAIMQFYKMTPEDILVIHDDLALPLGTVRTRIGGSDAGNNGLKSLMTHVGNNTARVRIGIATEDRPIGMQDADYVLGKFTKSQSAILIDELPVIFKAVEDFLADTFEPTTCK